MVGKHQLDGEDLESGSEPKSNVDDRTVDKGEKDRPETSTAELLDAEDRSNVGMKSKDASLGWMGWFSRPSNDKEQINQESAIEDERPPEDSPANGHPISQPPTKSGLADSNSINHVPSLNKDSQDSRSINGGSQAKDSSPVPSTSNVESAPRSWLGLWKSATPSAENELSSANPLPNDPRKTPAITKPSTDETGQISAASSLPTVTAGQPTETDKSYGWAFWSKEPMGADGSGKTRRTSVGELALAGSPSQSKPETVEIDETKLPSKAFKKGTNAPIKPESAATTTDGAKTDDKSSKPAFTAPSKITKESEPPLAKSNQTAANLLLPSLTLTYSTLERPSLLQQLGQFLQYRKPMLNTRHVSIQDPPRIKRALAIVSI